MFLPISCIQLKHKTSFSIKMNGLPSFPSSVVIYKHIPISQNTHLEYFHSILPFLNVLR